MFSNQCFLGNAVSAHCYAAKLFRCHAYVSPCMLRRHRCFPLQGIFGCGAHSDYGVMTLLATDGTPGLQIK